MSSWRPRASNGSSSNYPKGRSAAFSPTRSSFRTGGFDSSYSSGLRRLASPRSSFSTSNFGQSTGGYSGASVFRVSRSADSRPTYQSSSTRNDYTDRRASALTSPSPSFSRLGSPTGSYRSTFSPTRTTGNSMDRPSTLSMGTAYGSANRSLMSPRSTPPAHMTSPTRFSTNDSISRTGSRFTSPDTYGAKSTVSKLARAFESKSQSASPGRGRGRGVGSFSPSPGRYSDVGGMRRGSGLAGLDGGASGLRSSLSAAGSRNTFSPTRPPNPQRSDRELFSPSRTTGQRDRDIFSPTRNFDDAHSRRYLPSSYATKTESSSAYNRRSVTPIRESIETRTFSPTRSAASGDGYTIKTKPFGGFNFVRSENPTGYSSKHSSETAPDLIASTSRAGRFSTGISSSSSSYAMAGNKGNALLMTEANKSFDELANKMSKELDAEYESIKNKTLSSSTAASSGLPLSPRATKGGSDKTFGVVDRKGVLPLGVGTNSSSKFGGYSPGSARKANKKGSDSDGYDDTSSSNEASESLSVSHRPGSRRRRRSRKSRLSTSRADDPPSSGPFRKRLSSAERDSPAGRRRARSGSSSEDDSLQDSGSFDARMRARRRRLQKSKQYLQDEKKAVPALLQPLDAKTPTRIRTMDDPAGSDKKAADLLNYGRVRDAVQSFPDNVVENASTFQRKNQFTGKPSRFATSVSTYEVQIGKNRNLPNYEDAKNMREGDVNDDPIDLELCPILDGTEKKSAPQKLSLNYLEYWNQQALDKEERDKRGVRGLAAAFENNKVVNTSTFVPTQAAPTPTKPTENLEEKLLNRKDSLLEVKPPIAPEFKVTDTKTDKLPTKSHDNLPDQNKQEEYMPAKQLIHAFERGTPPRDTLARGIEHQEHSEKENNLMGKNISVLSLSEEIATPPQPSFLEICQEKKRKREEENMNPNIAMESLQRDPEIEKDLDHHPKEELKVAGSPTRRTPSRSPIRFIKTCPESSRISPAKVVVIETSPVPLLKDVQEFLPKPQKLPDSSANTTTTDKHDMPEPNADATKGLDDVDDAATQLQTMLTSAKDFINSFLPSMEKIDDLGGSNLPSPVPAPAKPTAQQKIKPRSKSSSSSTSPVKSSTSKGDATKLSQKNAKPRQNVSAKNIRPNYEATLQKRSSSASKTKSKFDESANLPPAKKSGQSAANQAKSDNKKKDETKLNSKNKSDKAEFPAKPLPDKIKSNKSKLDSTKKIQSKGAQDKGISDEETTAKGGLIQIKNSDRSTPLYILPLKSKLGTAPVESESSSDSKELHAVSNAIDQTAKRDLTAPLKTYRKQSSSPLPFEPVSVVPQSLISTAKDLITSLLSKETPSEAIPAKLEPERSTAVDGEAVLKGPISNTITSDGKEVSIKSMSNSIDASDSIVVSHPPVSIKQVPKPMHAMITSKPVKRRDSSAPSIGANATNSGEPFSDFRVDIRNVDQELLSLLSLGEEIEAKQKEKSEINSMLANGIGKLDGSRNRDVWAGNLVAKPYIQPLPQKAFFGNASTTNKPQMPSEAPPVTSLMHKSYPSPSKIPNTSTFNLPKQQFHDQFKKSMEERNLLFESQESLHSVRSTHQGPVYAKTMGNGARMTPEIVRPASSASLRPPASNRQSSLDTAAFKIDKIITDARQKELGKMQNQQSQQLPFRLMPRTTEPGSLQNAKSIQKLDAASETIKQELRLLEDQNKTSLLAKKTAANLNNTLPMEWSVPQPYAPRPPQRCESLERFWQVSKERSITPSHPPNAAFLPATHSTSMQHSTIVQPAGHISHAAKQPVLSSTFPSENYEKYDFTKKWLEGDLKSLAEESKPDLLKFAPSTPGGGYEDDERSIGSGSVEIDAIFNSNNRKSRYAPDLLPFKSERSQAGKHHSSPPTLHGPVKASIAPSAAAVLSSMPTNMPKYPSSLCSIDTAKNKIAGFVDRQQRTAKQENQSTVFGSYLRGKPSLETSASTSNAPTLVAYRQRQNSIDRGHVKRKVNKFEKRSFSDDSSSGRNSSCESGRRSRNVTDHLSGFIKQFEQENHAGKYRRLSDNAVVWVPPNPKKGTQKYFAANPAPESIHSLPAGVHQMHRPTVEGAAPLNKKPPALNHMLTESMYNPPGVPPSEQSVKSFRSVPATKQKPQAPHQFVELREHDSTPVAQHTGGAHGSNSTLTEGEHASRQRPSNFGGSRNVRRPRALLKPNALDAVDNLVAELELNTQEKDSSEARFPIHEGVVDSHIYNNAAAGHYRSEPHLVSSNRSWNQSAAVRPQIIVTGQKNIREVYDNDDANLSPQRRNQETKLSLMLNKEREDVLSKPTSAKEYARNFLTDSLMGPNSNANRKLSEHSLKSSNNLEPKPSYFQDIYASLEEIATSQPISRKGRAVSPRSPSATSCGGSSVGDFGTSFVQNHRSPGLSDRESIRSLMSSSNQNKQQATPPMPVPSPSAAIPQFFKHPSAATAGYSKSQSKPFPPDSRWGTTTAVMRQVDSALASLDDIKLSKSAPSPGSANPHASRSLSSNQNNPSSLINRNESITVHPAAHAHSGLPLDKARPTMNPVPKPFELPTISETFNSVDRTYNAPKPQLSYIRNYATPASTEIQPTPPPRRRRLNQSSPAIQQVPEHIYEKVDNQFSKPSSTAPTIPFHIRKTESSPLIQTSNLPTSSFYEGQQQSQTSPKEARSVIQGIFRKLTGGAGESSLKQQHSSKIHASESVNEINLLSPRHHPRQDSTNSLTESRYPSIDKGQRYPVNPPFIHRTTSSGVSPFDGVMEKSGSSGAQLEPWLTHIGDSNSLPTKVNPFVSGDGNTGELPSLDLSHLNRPRGFKKPKFSFTLWKKQGAK